MVALCTPTFSAHASAVVGGKCTKVGSFQLINKKVSICTKRGNSLTWALANSAQKAKYLEQVQKKLILDRKKLLENLLTVKDKYTNTTSLIPLANGLLLESTKAFIENSRANIAELQKQKTTEEQSKLTNQNNILAINNSISSAQVSVNSLQNQINTLQITVNNSKALSDSAYNSWISARAQSDFLSSSYQSALRSNAAIATSQVLCDFGFAPCTGNNSSQFNYNASIIREYNSASARTAGAYANYVSVNGQWVSNQNTLGALKSQQTQSSNNINTLNAQKNQANLNITNIDTKLVNFNSLITQAQAKFIPLENAEKRIAQDLSNYDAFKNSLDLKSAEFLVAIDAFFQMADESYVSAASSTNWNNRYGGLLSMQKEIDQKITELKSLISSLEVFLNSL